MLLPPAPALDTLVPADELAAELRLAADRVADEAVLEELEERGAGRRRAPPTRPRPTPVTWDIDVDTYNGHDRVQYYLDFFQGKGRERMGIWLTRMPRYEGDDSRAAREAGPAGRPGLPGADRERVLQHRHEPRQGGRACGSS